MGLDWKREWGYIEEKWIFWTGWKTRMNKEVNAGRDGKSSEETVSTVLWRTFPWLQNKHTIFDMNASHTHTGLRLPQYTMWSCALLLMARAVELIYYFWLLLLTWLKSKWLQPAGSVSTLKGTVSHLYSLSHRFIVFSIKSHSTVLWSVLKKIEFWD